MPIVEVDGLQINYDVQGEGEPLLEQCLNSVDQEGGSYPPGDLEALKQDRRWNAGREGTTHAHRSSWSRWR